MLINSINTCYSRIKLNRLLKETERKSSAEKNEMTGKDALCNIAYYPHPSFCGSKNNILRNDIIKEIEKSEPYSNAGLKGTVYKIEKDGKIYAVKVAKDSNVDFSKEAKILSSLPENMNGAQKFVDYFKHPETGAYILVTSFVGGENRVLNSEDDFNSLFGVLLQADASGVLHGDLNMQNLIFNDNGVNLIDFGEGELFDNGDSYANLMYPHFVLKSNVVNLEQNGIPDCIVAWHKNGDNVKENYKKYLNAKSRYYEEHADMLQKKGVNNYSALDYEKNLSNVLKNPSELIVNNEIRRNDVLYTFEAADTAVNYEKSPESAKEIWSLTIKKASDYKKEVQNALKNTCLTSDERKYFKYQQEIAEKFESVFKEWGLSTVSWINSIYLKDEAELSLHEKELKFNTDKKMNLPPDLKDLASEKLIV